MGEFLSPGIEPLKYFAPRGMQYDRLYYLHYYCIKIRSCANETDRLFLSKPPTLPRHHDNSMDTFAAQLRQGSLRIEIAKAKCEQQARLLLTRAVLSLCWRAMPAAFCFCFLGGQIELQPSPDRLAGYNLGVYTLNGPHLKNDSFKIWCAVTRFISGHVLVVLYPLFVAALSAWPAVL